MIQFMLFGSEGLELFITHKAVDTHQKVSEKLDAVAQWSDYHQTNGPGCT